MPSLTPLRGFTAAVATLAVVGALALASPAAALAPAPVGAAAAGVAPVACVAIPGWAEEDLPPIVTAAGLVFNGPQAKSVNYYQRVSAGNAQGLTGMAYTIAPGSSGYVAQLKVEVNPNADLGNGKGVLSYTTLSTINNPSVGTIDAQSGQWYASGILYASPGGMGNPLSWDDLVALMPNNVLLSAPSVHLQSNSTADAHSVVTSVTSSCGTTTFPQTTAAKACIPIAGWATEDIAPAVTAAGLVFNGPQVKAVNYYQRVSAGNAQGLTGMSYTLAPGTTGYKAELKVEVNPNADLGSGVIHYATLSTINTAASGTINAQSAQWYTTKIAYSSPGGMGSPLPWSALVALMPNNTLLSAPSLHLQSASTADSHSVVTSVTSSCGATSFVAAVAPPAVPAAPVGTGGTGAAATTPTTTAVAAPAVTATPTPRPTPSATAPAATDDTAAAGDLPTEVFDPQPAATDAPWWPWALGVALLLLLLALLAFILIRRRSSQQP